jgi:hypothetical protein
MKAGVAGIGSILLIGSCGRASGTESVDKRSEPLSIAGRPSATERKLRSESCITWGTGVLAEAKRNWFTEG